MQRDKKQYKCAYWSKDETKKLIKLLKMHECLWNAMKPSYRNRTLKTDAYEAIAKQFGPDKPVPEVKLKIHKLRSQHAGERNKMRRGNYTTHWRYFNSLNFIVLHDRNAKHEAEADQQEVQRPDSEVSTIDIQDSSPPELKLPEIVKITTLRQTQQPKRPATTFKTISRAKFNLRKLMPTSEALPNESVPCVKDEFSVFGEYVGNELRQLRNYEMLLLEAKVGIQKALSSAIEKVIEYKSMYSNASAKDEEDDDELTMTDDPLTEG